MSQTEFANSFGISLGTLRHWERGDRYPQGPALVLLNLLSKDPNKVLEVLNNWVKSLGFLEVATKPTSDAKQFPLSIDTVLKPLTERCKIYASDFLKKHNSNNKKSNTP